MKIRVTIDVAQADETLNEALGSLETGAFGCDSESAYRMFYKNRTDLIPFEDVVELGEDDRGIDVGTDLIPFEDVVELGEDDRGIDVARLCDLQWIDDNKTGVGFIQIDGKKYNFVLKEDENDN
jgi:hypothetical protein